MFPAAAGISGGVILHMTLFRHRGFSAAGKRSLTKNSCMRKSSTRCLPLLRVLIPTRAPSHRPPDTTRPPRHRLQFARCRKRGDTSEAIPSPVVAKRHVSMDSLAPTLDGVIVRSPRVFRASKKTCRLSIASSRVAMPEPRRKPRRTPNAWVFFHHSADLDNLMR